MLGTSSSHRLGRRSAVRLAAVLGAAGLALLLPRATGTSWTALARTWQQLPPWQVLLLAVVWFAGLVAHSWVLTGALPGLRRHQALTLNLTGSAVANVLPLGGGAGVALNLLMLRRWGFSPRDSSAFSVVTTACNAVVKAALPVLALPLLVMVAGGAGSRLVVGAVAGAAVVAAGVAAAAAVLGTRGGARLAGVIAHRLRPHLACGTVELRIAETRAAVLHALRTGGRAMLLGSTAYCVLGAVLLWCCLLAVGVHAGPVAVVALFAVERGLTAVPFTPGGAGVADLVVTALAVRLLSDPTGGHAAATAGVLLYRAYTFGAEIPVGALWLLAWVLAARRRVHVPVAAGDLEPTPLPDAA